MLSSGCQAQVTGIAPSVGPTTLLAVASASSVGAQGQSPSTLAPLGPTAAMHFAFADHGSVCLTYKGAFDPLFCCDIAADASSLLPVLCLTSLVTAIYHLATCL